MSNLDLVLKSSHRMKQDALWDFMQTEAPESFGGAGPRLGWLARQIPRGAKVLNVGVGDGGFERLAVSRGLEVYSLDPSEKAIERLNQRFRDRVEARAGRAEAIPWAPAFFDAVVMTEVLEHIDDEHLAPVLLEVARVLVPDGVFLGTVPANEDLRMNATVCPGCGHAFHRWGHVRSFSSDSLRAALQIAFVKVRIEERFFSPWNDLAPRSLVDVFATLGKRSAGAPTRSVGTWTRENWRALLSSAPRLAARRVGVRFPVTNWVFRAS